MTLARTAGPRHLVAYVLLSLIWGLSFLFMLRVVRAFGLVGAVSFRALVAALALAGAAWASGRRLHLRGRWRSFLVVGATTVVGQLAPLSFATHAIGTAMTAIVVGTIPVFSMVLAHASGHERIAARRVAGVALAIAGLVLLVGFPSVPLTPRFLGGCALALFGCFCAAFGSNYAAVRLAGTDPLSLAAGTFISGGVLGLPLAVIDPVAGLPGIVDWLNLLFLGGIVSALAYVIFYWLIGTIGPTRAVSVEFIVNVNGALIGVLFLGEHLSGLQLVGAATVLVGCAVVLDLARAIYGR